MLNARSPIAGSVVAIALGVLLLGADVAAFINTRKTQAQDLEQVRRLNVDLNAARVELAAARTGGDSLALHTRIEGRLHGINFIAYHLPERQALVDRWWRGGAGTIAGALAAALIAGGIIVRRRGAAPR